MMATPPAAVNPRPEMDLALEWVGFGVQNNRTAIMDEAFTDFNDIVEFNEKDIKDLAESFSKRTANDGRIIFGVRRIKRLKSMIHWALDFKRCSEEPSLDGLNAALFLEQLTIASTREEIRQSLMDQSDIVSKEASPGKLKDEKKWPEWEASMANYLSTIYGSFGIPISYVIRENDEPNTDGHDNFTEKSICSAPLEGPKFEADAKQVHQLIYAQVQGETAEQWIKPLSKKQNGRLDMKALRDHYSGEGNTSRRIAEAERLRDTLHYKNERYLSFTVFLSRMQRMFNIFKDEGEEYTEEQKVRFIFQKIQHPELMAEILALKVRQTMGDEITFTTAANHLTAALSILPDFVARSRVSNVSTSAGHESARIYRADGSIETGFIKEWGSLSKEDKTKVFNERKRLGIKRGKGGKKPNGDSEQLKKAQTQLKTLNKELNSKIAALKKVRFSNEEQKEDETPDDAGNQFGGRSQKKAKN